MELVQTRDTGSLYPARFGIDCQTDPKMPLNQSQALFGDHCDAKVLKAEADEGIYPDVM